MKHPVLDTYPPSHLASSITYEAQPELHPVRNDDTENVESELESDESASRSVGGDFCTPNGNDCVQVACSNTVDHSCT